MAEQDGNDVPMSRRERRRLETGMIPQTDAKPHDAEPAEQPPAEAPALADGPALAETGAVPEALRTVDAPAAPEREPERFEPAAPEAELPEADRPEPVQPEADLPEPVQPEAVLREPGQQVLVVEVPASGQPEPDGQPEPAGQSEPAGQPLPDEQQPRVPTSRREQAAAAAPSRRAGFVRSAPIVPPRGWRGMVYRLTGGAVNLGPSAQQRYELELAEQIGRRLEGSWNTAFLSLKGGIGKTSTTVGVGLTLAELRPDPPCAIDANPDAGDLVERALGDGAYESERQHSITALLRDCDTVRSRSELGAYLHQAGGLHLLAGEQDPELSDSLTADEYRRVHRLVSRYFGVTLTDCGTGVTHPAMQGILQDADNIVVVAGYAVSGAKRARDTLHWLAAHGYERLAKSAVVVVTDKDGVSGRVDKETIEDTLAGLCKALITVPHDKSMADGDLVSLATLKPDTRNAYREIAAAIVSGYER